MTRSASLLALPIALLPPRLSPRRTGPSPHCRPAQRRRAGGSQDDDHHDHGDDIVVTGIRRKAGDVLGGLSVLDGEELARELRPSIGETLARQPGVTASSFGPTASRPILRGLVGRPHPRPDRRHRQLRRVGLQPRPCGRDQPADRRADRGAARPVGAALRLLGDRRRGQCHRPPHPARRAGGRLSTSTACSTYGTAAEERSANLSVDGEVARHFVVHADGNWSKSDDLRTGGHLLTKELREEAAASPFPEIQELADLKGELPNTAAKSWELAGRRRLCRRRPQCRRVGTRVTTPSMACRSASRSTRPSRPRRRPSTSSRPATTPAPKSRSSGFFSQVRAARRLCQVPPP